jgi:hypothetical protein
MSGPNTFPKRSFEAPYRDQLTDSNGIISYPWAAFIRGVFDRLYSLGAESFFTLINNQASAADITGMKFSARGVSVAFVDYLIQRVTTGAGAAELIAAGNCIFVYNPISLNWSKQQIGSEGPGTSGITLSITAAGQVQYTSTNVTGAASISKIFWRARTLAAKNKLYSSVAAK